MKFHTLVFLENLSRKLNFRQTLRRITATINEDRHTFMFISRCFPLRMRSVSDIFVMKIKTLLLSSVIPPRQNRFVCVEKYFRAIQDTDDNMTHAHYVLDT